MDAGTRIARRILDELERIPEFDSDFRELVREEAGQCDQRRQRRLAEFENGLLQIDRQEMNLTTAIRETGALPALLQGLHELHDKREGLLLERDNALQECPALTEIPSVAEIRALARAAISDLLPGSAEFGRQIRRIVTRLIAVPFQLVDGSCNKLRAFVEVDLSDFAGASTRGDVSRFLKRRFVLDLFEPPQREAHRERVVALREQGQRFGPIGQSLGITDTAAQRAAALQRQLNELGISDPYIRVLDPNRSSGICRHAHPRFRFRTIAGFVPPASIDDWLGGQDEECAQTIDEPENPNGDNQL